MSGQPYKYASDPAKFRDEFMKTLSLQASINAMNLDANKTYAETGQLPPVSQMKDTRTTAEILADTERLKLDMIKELEPVANPQFASVVLQRIQQSPLNLDGSLFTFFVQRAPEIVKNLQKLYKYKIKGDANDAETFVKFIEDMYTKTKNMTGSVKSFFNRPISESKSPIIYGDVEKLSIFFEEVARKLLISKGKLSDEGMKKKIKNISATIHNVGMYLSNAEYVRNVADFITSQTRPVGTHGRHSIDEHEVNRFYDLYTRYFEELDRLPKFDTVYELIRQFDKSIANANTSLSSKILDEILMQFEPVSELIKISSELRDFREGIDLGFDFGSSSSTSSSSSEYPRITSSSIEEHELIHPIDRIADFASSLINPITDYMGITTEHDRLINDLQQAKKLYQDEIKRNEILIKNPDISREEQARLMKELEQADLEIRQIDQEIKSMRGRGLIRRRGRPKGSGIGRKSYKESIKAHQDLSKGVDEYPRFVKFGKYLINTRKLHDNTLALKSSSGNGIINFPSKRISANLTATIKKMINGGNIGFSDISGLSEPEKAYLHKVAKQSGILEKFDIPAPSKDAHEKDIHEFEVMKGEIMSGNDSTELIKRFKLHIMKLSRNGTLPKHEVNEILSDLVNLGY